MDCRYLAMRKRLLAHGDDVPWFYCPMQKEWLRTVVQLEANDQQADASG